MESSALEPWIARAENAARLDPPVMRMMSRMSCSLRDPHAAHWARRMIWLRFVSGGKPEMSTDA